MAEPCQKIGILPYPVMIGTKIWDEAARVLSTFNPAGGFCLLTDENVARHCLPVIGRLLPGLSDAPVFTIPAGESSKDIAMVEKIWKWLMDSGVERDSVLINLGGGLVSDLGGFAAGTFKRGIRYVNIPTSLIGQADASVGGKTGVNINRIKNQAGLFQDPSAVLIDPGFLQTLPSREMISGYAELIKSGLLSGGEFWDMVRTPHAINRDSIPELIWRAVNFKCDVVARDPLENGWRKILNFGHTIGHAFESLSGRDGIWQLTHGEAVAAGMICEGFLSYRLTGFSRETLDELVSIITTKFRLPSLLADHRRRFRKIMVHDKKNFQGSIRFVLLKSPGNPLVGQYSDSHYLEDSFDFYNQAVTS
ncbi:MAG: 3-dehydroquinate synthase [Bacteroidales bacterium]|nr:3-dehydroquinate synthase [Bacteroidales bacterium]